MPERIEKKDKTPKRQEVEVMDERESITFEVHYLNFNEGTEAWTVHKARIDAYESAEKQAITLAKKYRQVRIVRVHVTTEVAMVWDIE